MEGVWAVENEPAIRRTGEKLLNLMMYFLLHPISSLNYFIARVITDQISLFIALAFFIYLAFNYKTPYWQSLDKKVCEWVEKSPANTLKARAEDFAFFGNAVFHISYSIVLSISRKHYQDFKNMEKMRLRKKRRFLHLGFFSRNLIQQLFTF